MLKGGYKIIDFKGGNIDPDAEDPSITVDGIYDAIEANYNKALLFSGLLIDDVEIPDFYAKAELSGDDYVVTYGLVITPATASATGSVVVKTLTIDDDDKVTLATVTGVLPTTA